MHYTEASYPAPYPHDSIVEIADDVFMVRGCITMKPLMRITRNMAIVRDGSSLTLVNPIRLDRKGETSLTALGSVDRIVRLGAHHGHDDRYYVEQLGAKLWSQPDGDVYSQPPIDVELGANSALPFPGAELFPFEGIKQPECALLLERSGGLLLTCDAIQHYGDYKHNSLLTRVMLPFLGFPKTTVVGPIWLKYVTTDRRRLRTSFDRLLEREFDSLLSAHGSFLASGARASVRAAVERALAKND